MDHISPMVEPEPEPEPESRRMPQFLWEFSYFILDSGGFDVQALEPPP